MNIWDHKSQAKAKHYTRTWTWRKPHWWPRASFGKSWGVHQMPQGASFQQPGTGGTATQKRHR